MINQYMGVAPSTFQVVYVYWVGFLKVSPVFVQGEKKTPKNQWHTHVLNSWNWPSFNIDMIPDTPWKMPNSLFIFVFFLTYTHVLFQSICRYIIVYILYTPWKFNIALKMDGWKMSFLLGFPIFRGYVKLRGGIFIIFPIIYIYPWIISLFPTACHVFFLLRYRGRRTGKGS